jgi:hypothetical protein
LNTVKNNLAEDSSVRFTSSEPDSTMMIMVSKTQLMLVRVSWVETGK